MRLLVGYGRSPVDLKAFIAKQCVNVADDPSYPQTSLFERISFHAGGYDASASYSALDEELAAYEREHWSGKPGNRLFFLSVPPSVFGTVAEMISHACRAQPGGFTRLMIEKPFGRDSQTFEELNLLTARHFREVQLFRIDHYLGKEVILNLPALRWANACFEPLWSNQHIESVLITFKENIGTDGCAPPHRPPLQLPRARACPRLLPRDEEALRRAGVVARGRACSRVQARRVL